MNISNKATRILLATELFWPETTSSGYFITEIAKYISDNNVSSIVLEVVTCYPTYSQKGKPAPPQEKYKNIDIVRVTTPNYDKNNSISRLYGSLLISYRICREVWGRDSSATLFGSTNPPFLKYGLAFIARLRRQKMLLLVHDMFPETLASIMPDALGRLVSRVLWWPTKWAYEQCWTVIVLSASVKERIVSYYRMDEDRIAIAPNWADTMAITPLKKELSLNSIKHGLAEKHVIQFSGNIGRTHDTQLFVEVVSRMSSMDDVHFFVFGWGAAFDELSLDVGRRGLKNITITGPCAQVELSDYLSCSDLFMIPMRKNLVAGSVPSRIYNMLAAGRPVLVVSKDRLTYEDLLEDNGCGEVISDYSADYIVEKIISWISDNQKLQKASCSAAYTVEKQYNRDVILSRYNDVVTAAVRNER